MSEKRNSISPVAVFVDDAEPIRLGSIEGRWPVVASIICGDSALDLYMTREAAALFVLKFVSFLAAVDGRKENAPKLEEVPNVSA